MEMSVIHTDNWSIKFESFNNSIKCLEYSLKNNSSIIKIPIVIHSINILGLDSFISKKKNNLGNISNDLLCVPKSYFSYPFFIV